MMKYSSRKPTEPGWYWCRNMVTDSPSGEWEAIVRIERVANVSYDERRGSVNVERGGLAASWMQAPGKVGVMAENEWSEGCQWAGPIQPPGLVTEPVRGSNIELAS